MPVIAKVNNARNIKMSIRYARDGKDPKGHPKLHDSIGINCNPENAENDFEATNFVNRWRSRNHVQLKKFVLGFGPLTKNTLSAREAHIYTERLLNKYNKSLGGGWRIVAYAHKDHPKSYHYHVLIDNCNIKNGHKLTTAYKDVEQLRNLNDDVSKSFGIKPVKKARLVNKDMPEIKGQSKAQNNNKPRYSYQDHARVLISKAMMHSNNFQEFQHILNYNNASLKPNFTNEKAKYGTIVIPSIQPNYYYNHDKNGERSKRKIRTSKLGLAFDKQNILKQLSKPIGKRDNKYMDIYSEYNNTPSSVVLKNITPTPFMGNDDNKERTSSEYLNVPIIRNRFKEKGEINRERQFNLIRTIEELNSKFEAEKSVSKRPEQRFVESNSKGNRQEQKIDEAEREVEKPIKPFREQHSRTYESSVRRAKQSVDRAKRRIGTISTGPERKSAIKKESNASSKSSSRQKRPAQSDSQSKGTSSKRELSTSPGQRAIKLSNQHLRITDENQKQYHDEDKKLLSREEQREINEQKQQSQQNIGWFQRCQKAFRNIRRTEWKRVHRELSKFSSLVSGIRETFKDNARYISNLTKGLSERYSIKKQSNGNNQYQERYSKNQEHNTKLQKRHGTINHKSIDSLNSQYSQDNHQLGLIQNYNNQIYPKLEKSNSKLYDLSNTRFHAKVENHMVDDELTEFDKHHNIGQGQNSGINAQPHRKVINRKHHRGPHLS